MASSVLHGENFHQILKKYKKRLTAEINFDDVEDLLIVKGFLQKDDYCNIGEVIIAMISHGNHCWSIHKCIQVFKAIKEHRKYVSCTCVNLVIDELEQAESSSNYPEQVESSQSVEEDLQLLESVGLDYLIRDNPELENMYLESIPINKETKAKSDQAKKCPFNRYLQDGSYVLETLPVILEKYLPKILQDSGMFLQVICASCIEMLKRYDIDDLSFDLSEEADKINKLFKNLRKQVQPIDVKKVIREDLLPCISCIGSIVRKITKPQPKSWFTVAWESLRFKLIDTDNLKMLCYYDHVLEYLLDMVAFLIKIDPRSPTPMTRSTLEGIQKSWIGYRDSIIGAKNLYKSISGDVAKAARIRGWATSVAYSTLALGIFIIPGGSFLALSIASGVAAGGIILAGGFYTESYIKALPDTVKSCDEGIAKELTQTLSKIPAKELKKFCTDLTD